MDAFIVTLYVLGFPVVVFLAAATFATLWANYSTLADAWVTGIFGLVFVAIFGILWFTFGDIAIREVLGWFFDIGASVPQNASPSVPQNVPPPGPSTSFSDHPVIWLVHLFAYAVIAFVLAVVFLIVGIFMLSRDALEERTVVATILGMIFVFFGTMFYWRFEGMEILISWFG